MIKTRNHYVPKFYLKGFCDSNNKVWMYDKTDSSASPKAGSPSSVAVGNKLYHLSGGEADLPVDAVENYFSSVESPASKVYQKLLSKQFPGAGEKELLSLFFAMLMVRTPVYMSHLKAQHSRLLREKAVNDASDRETFSSSYKKFYPELSDDEIEEDRQFILQGEIEATKNYVLTVMITMGGTIAPLLNNMRWSLIETNDNRPFVTSDNFMQVTNINNPESLFSRGMDMKGAFVFFPLSKHLGLLMVNDEKFPENVVYDPANPPALNGGVVPLNDLIDILNQRTIITCYRYVFSNSPDLGAQFHALMTQIS